VALRIAGHEIAGPRRSYSDVAKAPRSRSSAAAAYSRSPCANGHAARALGAGRGEAVHVYPA